MSSDKDNKIVPFNNLTNRVPFVRPATPDGLGLTQRTLTQISNAMDAHAYLDDQGKLWIAVDALSTIIRTTIANANYILDRFSESEKHQYDNKIYIAGYLIIGQITAEIESSGLEKRGHYLRFSEDCLRQIRDSDMAKAKRGEYEAYWREEKSKLKRQRIKLYTITIDELTGQPLDFRTAEFSHIRSVSRYKHLLLEIENGLIVNKSSHDQITQAEINDEDELIFLCSELGWSTTWYEVYKTRFN